VCVCVCVLRVCAKAEKMEGGNNHKPTTLEGGFQT
jgi:hypothetical protein